MSKYHILALMAVMTRACGHAMWGALGVGMSGRSGEIWVNGDRD